MITAKTYKFIIAILIIGILGMGWYIYDTIDEYESINKIYQDQMYIRLLGMRSNLRSTDRSLANILVTLDMGSQFSSIVDAQNQITLMIHNDLNSVLFWNINYLETWSEAKKYLDYLLTKEELLNDIERENLSIIRQRLNIIIPGFNSIVDVAKEKDWNKYFQNNERVKSILEEMDSNLKKLPNIGENDEAYKQSKYKYIGYYPREVFKTERVFNEEELSKLARNFMGKLWNNDLNITKGGGGHGPVFGSYISFNGTQNNRLVGSYEVKISKLGGHILSAQSQDDYEFKDDFNQEEDITLGEMSNEEAIEYGKELIKRWNEEDLELYNVEQKQTNLIMTFVPLRNNIALLNRRVEIVINPTIGKLLRFNADRYFTYYGKEAPAEYELSKEQVINLLDGRVEIIGEPKLEAMNGISGSDIIVYTVTVKGIDKVSRLHINAINARNEGIVYD